MNRRDFAYLLAGAPLVGALAGITSRLLTLNRSRVKFGYLNVEIAKAKGFLPAQVFLNGEPLPDCHSLNDIEGWADCWKKDEDGHFRLTDNRDGVESVRHYGHVTYIPNPNGKPGTWGRDL